MAAVLASPTDPLPRLVLADYLDDAGGEASTAWAEYIRLKAAANAEPSALKRELMRDTAAGLAGRVVASLTLPASAFLAEPAAFLDLLPAKRFTLRLAGFTPPRVTPEADTCRAWRGIPLGPAVGLLAVGVIPEATEDNWSDWAFRHGPALFLRIPTADLEPAIQRVYAPRVLALIMPRTTAEPVIPTLDEQLGAASAGMVLAYVEQLVGQARERGAAAIDMVAYETHHWVRRVENGRLVRWHRVGTDLGQALVRAAKSLPGRRLGVRVRVRNSSFGEGVRIILLNPPAGPGVRIP